VINYLNGDSYTGELVGGHRHGLGIFQYKEANKKVIGKWKDNFLLKDGIIHPDENLVGMLVPLGVSKFEGR
jgi:hypothetical protein